MSSRNVSKSPKNCDPYDSKVYTQSNAKPNGVYSFVIIDLELASA